jgi:hypothetical protein
VPVLPVVVVAAVVLLPVVEPVRLVASDWNATHWPSWEMTGSELSPFEVPPWPWLSCRVISVLRSNRKISRVPPELEPDVATVPVESKATRVPLPDTDACPLVPGVPPPDDEPPPLLLLLQLGTRAAAASIASPMRWLEVRVRTFIAQLPCSRTRTSRKQPLKRAPRESRVPVSSAAVDGPSPGPRRRYRSIGRALKDGEETTARAGSR